MVVLEHSNYLENVETDSPSDRRNIWMPDLGNKPHFGGVEWVSFRDLNFQLESSTLVRCIRWACNFTFKFGKILPD